MEKMKSFALSEELTLSIDKNERWFKPEVRVEINIQEFWYIFDFTSSLSVVLHNDKFAGFISRITNLKVDVKLNILVIYIVAI